MSPVLIPVSIFIISNIFISSDYMYCQGVFSNRLAYFYVAVDYKRKLFMKFVPDDGYPEIKSEEQMLVKK